MKYDKLLSGKFWLTIISGLIFAYVSVTGTLNGEAVASIISMVFIAYFQKDRHANNKPN